MPRLDYKDITLLSSAERTAAVQSADFENINRHRGILIEIDITAITDTPAVTVTLQGKIGANYYTILASAALAAVAKTYLRVYPGLTNSNNLIANDFLPDKFRVSVTVGDADPATYSVKAKLIP